MGRIRRVEDVREMERLVDDYVTRGYRLKNQGDATAVVSDRDWGSGLVHVLVAVLTLWWTFGLGNLIYAAYSRYTADEVVIRVVDP